MAQQQGRPAGQQAAPVHKSRTITISPVIFVLVLVLTFVCGLLAGSMISGTNLAKQSAPVQAAAPQAQAPQQTQAAQQPSVPPEMQRRIRDLEAAVLKEPKKRAALVDLGNAYFDTGQYSSSIQAYEAALAINANDASVLTDCGVMYRAVGDYDKAIAKFVQAQQVEPGHAIAMFNQGVVLNYDLHQHEEGLKVWRELVRLHPNASAPDGRPVQDLIRQVEAE